MLIASALKLKATTARSENFGTTPQVLVFPVNHCITMTHSKVVQKVEKPKTVSVLCKSVAQAIPSH